MFVLLTYYITCGCSAASNWQPGPHAMSTNTRICNVYNKLNRSPAHVQSYIP